MTPVEQAAAHIKHCRRFHPDALDDTLAACKP
jgi:hypothetical protein